MKANLNSRMTKFLTLLLLIILLGLILFRDPSLSLNCAVLGGCIIATGFVPSIWLIATSPETRTSFPLLPLTGLYYAMFFGFPVFLSHKLRTGPEGEITIYRLTGFSDISLGSQILVLIGLALLYAAYILAKRLVRHSEISPYKINLDTGEPVIRGLAWVLLISHAGYLFIPFISKLPSIGQFLQPAGFLALGILYVTWRRGNLPTAEKLILIFIFGPILVTYYISGTFLTPIMMLIVLLLALEFWISGRLPYISIVTAVLVFVVIYPLFTDIRNSILEKATHNTLTERIKATAMAIISDVPQNKKRISRYFTATAQDTWVYRGIITRIGNIFVFSKVFEMTPDPIPYWEGKTYKPLLTSFIPRAIWSDKPQERAGGTFGKRYGFLEANDNTSVNIPWITEMYANFGRWGLMLGMTLVGLMIGILETLFCQRRQGDIGIIFGASLCLPVFYQESNFSVMMGSFIPLAVCFWIYLRIGIAIKKTSA